LVLNAIADKIAKTKFGQKSLKRREALLIFAPKPGLRVYAGLVLLIISFFAGIPAIALLSFLSLKLREPFIVAAGVPIVFILVHIMFGLGIYLAGRNYGNEILVWITKKFIEKYGH